ncbi:MAG: DMT family transporter [Oscillospiraceae bacterium]|nr:DMT family transporter [Oscillospiraceae bacterium]
MTKQNTKALLSLLVSMALFGTIGIFVPAIPLASSTVAMVRGIVGAAVLALWQVLRGKKLQIRLPARQFLLLAASGAAIGLNWILLFESYRFTSVATATLCYYLSPTIVIFAAAALFGEKLGAKKLLCAALALTGMVFVAGLPQSGMPAGSEAKGILLALGAAVLYASVVLLNKKLGAVAAETRTLLQLGFAGLVLLPYCAGAGALQFSAMTPASWAVLALVGVVHTGLCYLLYFSAVGELPAQTAALMSYIDPVTAVLLSVTVLRQPMDGWAMLGAALIIGAAMASEMEFKKK